MGTKHDLERLVDYAIQTKSVETHVFEDADHCYLGHEQTVVAVIANWINSL